VLAHPSPPALLPAARRLSFLQLIGFGLSLFTKASNEARLNLLAKGLPGLVVMLAGLVPTLGDYYGSKSGKKGGSS
jgi:lycopene beta-cyclase